MPGIFTSNFIIMKNMNGWGKLAFVLLVIGGINWGLIGAFDSNVVAMIFGDKTLVVRIVYALVGLSALFVAFGGGQRRSMM
jgi:uncharacterized membrane protein YuzA (DUF378 family)